jgi:ribonuclease J
VFYGGVGEIGGNKVLAKSVGGSIFFDFGLSYGAQGLFFEEFLKPRTNSKFYDLSRLGLLPVVDGIYRRDAFCPEGLTSACTPTLKYWNSKLMGYDEAGVRGAWRPDALFLSHAHADHYGYLPLLGDIPIHCSQTTKTLLKAISQVSKLDGFDSELTDYEFRRIKQNGERAYFPGSYTIEKEENGSKERTFNCQTAGKQIAITDNLKITSFNVGHSIPGSRCALAEIENKQILYTGDIRFHGRVQHDLSILKGLKPDVMITEGTRIDEHIPDNEQRVEKDMCELIDQTEGLVMIGFAWKDLERYETVRDAALACNRTPVFDSKVAYLLKRLNKDIYQENAKVFIERTDSLLYSPSDYTRCKHSAGYIDETEWDIKTKTSDTIHLDKGVRADEISKNPDKYVLHLDYFRFKNLLDMDLQKNSTYIRAQCEPFDPRMEISQQKLINWLRHFGINEADNYEPYQIHASGHASGKELQEFIDEIKPKKLIPIHTVKPKLFHNNNGEIIIPQHEGTVAI